MVQKKQSKPKRKKTPVIIEGKAKKENTSSSMGSSCEVKKKFDWLLWGSLAIVAQSYFLWAYDPSFLTDHPRLSVFSESVFTLFNKMWWGLALGIFFVGLIGFIPRDVVIHMLGRQKGINGLLRSVAAGFFLDLCSHGVLLIGMKLYERGARLGQVMAFLIASPWNSFSLTVILFSLIGVFWTLIFILFSLVIALISGLIFDHCVEKKILPPNLRHGPAPDDFKPFQAVKDEFLKFELTLKNFARLFVQTVGESKLILKWVFFGVIVVATIRTWVPGELFQGYFGPTVIGLGLTFIASIIIEVCSEGSAPIAADLMLRAKAPGNSFTFLMSGVSTDYTEIMGIKETTRSWKIALFLPLITVPQILFLALIMNYVGY